MKKFLYRLELKSSVQRVNHYDIYLDAKSEATANLIKEMSVYETA